MQAQGIPGKFRLLLGVCGLALIIAAAVYIKSPLVVEKTTKESKTATATNKKVTVDEFQSKGKAMEVILHCMDLYKKSFRQ